MKRIVIAIILLFILFQIVRRVQLKRDTVSRFRHDQAKSLYTDLCLELGHPDIVFNRPNGFVEWNIIEYGVKFSSVLLKDDDNRKFVYMTIPFESQIYPVAKDNVFFNRQTSELTANGNSLEECALLLIDIIQTSNKTTRNAMNDRIVERFGKKKDKKKENLVRKIPISP